MIEWMNKVLSIFEESWFLGLHAWPNMVTMCPPKFKECYVCHGFYAHNSATTQGLESFSKPRATGSKLGRPLPSNPSNPPDSCWPGPPEYHSAFERWAIPDRFNSSSLLQPSWKHCCAPLAFSDQLHQLLNMYCIDLSSLQDHEPSPMPCM